MPHSNLLLFVLIALFNAIQPIYSEQSNKDSLTPYLGAPPTINLTTSDISKLEKGSKLYKTLDTNKGKQQVIIFKVNASKEKIWQIIKNYAHYPDWVKNVAQTEIYKKNENQIYVRFVLKHWYLGKYEYYVQHQFSTKEENWAVWQLDKNKSSDFKESIGFWRVYPAENNTEQNYVAYSADLRFKEKKSNYVQKHVIKNSLKQASIWVKKQSEKH